VVAERRTRRRATVTAAATVSAVETARSTAIPILDTPDGYMLSGRGHPLPCVVF